nr:hypothetical protein GTC16762_33380 [Pigmentibacter ruber]
MFEVEFLIKKLSREFKNVFLDIVNSVNEEIDFEDLIKAIEEKNLSGVKRAVKFEKFQQNLKQFSPVILQTINIAANEMEKSKHILLDLDREVNLSQVKTVTNKLITGLTEQQDKIIKDIVYDGIDRQLSVKTIADKIKLNINLNATQVKTLKSIEDNLISKNANKEVINKIIEEKAKQMLKTRAETIAVTESANAVSAGRDLMQKQMFLDGDIPTNTKKEWITASDERQCGNCAPMNGQIVSINELFTTGFGAKVERPPLHARCRCFIVIKF